MIMIIFILGGCSSVLDSVLMSSSPDAVLKKAVEAHAEVDAVEVTFTEDLGDYTDTGLMKIDFKNEESHIKFNEDDIAVFIDKDDLLVEYIDGEVESWGRSSIFIDLENKVKHHQNPLKFFKQIDGEIFGKFDMEKEKGKYLLTYNGTKEDKELLGKALAYFELTGTDDFDEMLEYFDIEVKSLDLTLIIDSSTYLIEKIDQKLDYVFYDEDEETKTTITNEYKKYDNVGEIEKLVATIENDEGLNNDDKREETGDVADLTDKEIKQYEKEASAYLEALIEATVFQNVEGFIKKAPDSMSDDEKKSEAELQRDFFKEMYVQNTKDNMVGTGVSDDEVEELTDAFLEAIATTKYEVVGAKLESPDNIVVTISVQGIDDTDIYAKTEDEIYDVVMEGKVEEEELISKNMEILSNNYRKVDSLLDAVEVDVDVTRDDGQYLVMLQDQFLIGGFVQ